MQDEPLPAYWEPWYMSYVAVAILVGTIYAMCFCIGCVAVLNGLMDQTDFSILATTSAKWFTIIGVLIANIWALIDYAG